MSTITERYEQLLENFRALEEADARKNEQLTDLQRRVDESEMKILDLENQVKDLNKVIEQKVEENTTLTRALEQTGHMADRTFMMLENFSKGVAK